MSIGRLTKMFIVTASLLIIPISLISCGGGGDALREMMKQTPDEATSITYVDAKAMSDDSDLHGLLDKWKADNETELAFYGIERDNVEHYMKFSDITGNDSVIVTGNFDTNDLRQQLESRDFDDKDFKLVEVWESPDGLFWLAVPEGSIIGGAKETVKDVIRVIKGDASIYEDQDAFAIVDRLPEGLIVRYQEYAEGAPFNGLVAYGESLKKQSAAMIQVEMLYKFLEPEQAADVMEDVAEDVDEYYDKVKYEQDGRYVVIKAEVEIEDLL